MTEKDVRAFLERLGMQALRRGLSNGCPASSAQPDAWLRCACQELGQVAEALGRERYELAAAECMDLAQAAMLLWCSLQPGKGQQERT